MWSRGEGSFAVGRWNSMETAERCFPCIHTGLWLIFLKIIYSLGFREIGRAFARPRGRIIKMDKLSLYFRSLRRKSFFPAPRNACMPNINLCVISLIANAVFCTFEISARIVCSRRSIFNDRARLFARVSFYPPYNLCPASSVYWYNWWRTFRV